MKNVREYEAGEKVKSYFSNIGIFRDIKVFFT